MAAYYFARTLDAAMDDAVERVTEALKAEGFGILTEIDVAAVMKKKLDVDLRPYRILGACNPHFAYQALQAEEKIGTMLPCNVIVRETDDGQTEVAAVDPVASMQAIDNAQLGALANTVRERLRHVVEAL